MSKHTPGPWSCERIWDQPETKVHVDLDGGPVAIAEVFTMRFVGEREANAKLIAAAPELLEALRPFAKFACSGPCDCMNCRARAAIAKATE